MARKCAPLPLTRVLEESIRIAEEDKEEEETDDVLVFVQAEEEEEEDVFRPFVKFIIVFNDAAETEEEHTANDVPLCAAKAPPNNIFVISISLFPS